jgi:hypothetical protein
MTRNDEVAGIMGRFMYSILSAAEDLHQNQLLGVDVP